MACFYLWSPFVIKFIPLPFFIAAQISNTTKKPKLSIEQNRLEVKLVLDLLSFFKKASKKLGARNFLATLFQSFGLNVSLISVTRSSAAHPLSVWIAPPLDPKWVRNAVLALSLGERWHHSDLKRIVRAQSTAWASCHPYDLCLCLLSIQMICFSNYAICFSTACIWPCPLHLLFG